MTNFFDAAGGFTMPHFQNLLSFHTCYHQNTKLSLSYFIHTLNNTTVVLMLPWLWYISSTGYCEEGSASGHCYEHVSSAENTQVDHTQHLTLHHLWSAESMQFIHLKSLEWALQVHFMFIAVTVNRRSMCVCSHALYIQSCASGTCCWSKRWVFFARYFIALQVEDLLQV